MFEAMMELSEQSGLEMDGAVSRPELVYGGPYDHDMSPELRSQLEDYVFAHTPCRHKFNDRMGKRGIVYFDSRGRAADCLIGEMAASELMRQARLHGWRGGRSSQGGGPGDTPHSTLAMQDGSRPGAGYVRPYTEQEEIPASDIPDPTDEDADYMPLARRMVRVIGEQCAPRSKVTAKRKKDGNILIHVDQYTPLVVDPEGYVYETTYGHVRPNRRVGHIRDLLETGFEFKLNALSRGGYPMQLTRRDVINEEDTRQVPEGPMREAAEKLRESFGGMQFDANRAWVIGVDRNTLDQLVATGALDHVGDQYQLVKLRQESIDLVAERMEDEGWGALEEASWASRETDWKTSTRRSNPVSANIHKNVSSLGRALFGSLEMFERGLNIAGTWEVMVDDDRVYKMAGKIDRATTKFDRHSRTWRAGVNLWIERQGRIDIPRLIKDVKASMKKADALIKQLDKLAKMVEKVAPEEYGSYEQGEVANAREGHRRFMKDAELLVKGLQAAAKS